jgi:hypothetical protein
MANLRRTARGEAVDIDMLRLANEEVIAVGNMRTNAKGDELGAGGKVVKTRSQIMSEYHKLNTPLAHDRPNAEPTTPKAKTQILQPTAQDALPTSEPIQESPQEETSKAYVKPRGSFADSVAKETEIKQELLDPSQILSKSEGIQRI